MINHEGEVPEEMDFSQNGPDDTVWEIHVIDDEDLPVSLREGNRVMLFYTPDELSRLGTGNIEAGAGRVMHELEFGSNSIDELLAEGDRPMEDELRILPPIFRVPPYRLD